jgi:C-terminal processing protease CtpA/Prc
LLSIKDSSRYVLYDDSPSYCGRRRAGALSSIRSALDLRGDTLYLRKGVMDYPFVRTAALPDRCGRTIPESRRLDPVYNFDVFSEVVERHFAFFPERGIDWPLLADSLRGQLEREPSDLRLYQILEHSLDTLGDNHAFLEAGEEVYALLEQQTGNEPEEEAEPEIGDFVIADRVADHHLQEELTEDSWLLRWGTIADGIGYIQVKAMWLYADLDVPDSLIEQMGYVDAYVHTFQRLPESDYIDREVAAVDAILDRVMEDLQETKSLIIDVRFNGGGQDGVSYAILRRLNDRRRPVARVKLKGQAGFQSTHTLYLDAVSRPYLKPIWILISQQTGSAAEAFAIGSMALPHLRRVGMRTQGALSTALEKTLPNGWAYAISNEVYMDLANQSYEDRGVPVDDVIPYPADRQRFFRSVGNDLAGDRAAILSVVGGE